MAWIWGEKKNEVRKKMDFETSHSGKDLVTRPIKIQLELKVNYPSNLDLQQALLGSKVLFDLPSGLEVQEAFLTHIDLL